MSTSTWDDPRSAMAATTTPLMTGSASPSAACAQGATSTPYGLPSGQAAAAAAAAVAHGFASPTPPGTNTLASAGACVSFFGSGPTLPGVGTVMVGCAGSVLKAPVPRHTSITSPNEGGRARFSRPMRKWVWCWDRRLAGLMTTAQVGGEGEEWGGATASPPPFS